MSVRAVVVDPSVPQRFVIREFEDPQPMRNEAVVRVHAVSINRGEVRYSMTAPAGRRPGWDLAGVVEKAAADGSGPKVGTRVVGILLLGSWAELVAVPTNQLAELPENVSFTTAATLPVAGLTPLYALGKSSLLCGGLLAKKILITGSTGGTGDFAIQLAKTAGAKVVAIIRADDEQKHDFVKRAGVDEIAVGEDPSSAEQYGPYDLILDSVGGTHFGKVLAMLTPQGGTCVVFGGTAGMDVSFNLSKFYSTGPHVLYGFILFKEFGMHPASEGLKQLATLVSQDKLRPQIELQEPWENVAEICQALTDRKFLGKAVLHLIE